ncbi:MAG: hypothetical protein AB1489_42935, partial [Acidobacteriota bacterium]
LSAAGTICVLCLGTLAAGEGAIRDLLGIIVWYDYLPFLRRYQPTVAFPLFFLFSSMVWQTVMVAGRKAYLWASAAGIVFILMVFSYFYLWTAAAAWFIGLAILLSIADRSGTVAILRRLSPIIVLGIIGLIPYFFLLSQQNETISQVHLLTKTHRPDLVRLPELIGCLVLVAISVVVIRRKLSWRNPSVIFTISFAVLPFIVFNQQIITGRSMQPMHYEQFIANYVVLLGVVTSLSIIWLNINVANRAISRRIIVLIGVASLLWGCLEVVRTTETFRNTNEMNDQMIAVANRLKERERESTSPAIVFAPIVRVGDMAMTVTPQTFLWASFMPLYTAASEKETRERLYKHLYYTGININELHYLMLNDSRITTALLGMERAFPILSVDTPALITTEEIVVELQQYLDYTRSFNYQCAAQTPITYLINVVDYQPNFANLDRWYERDQGEQIGIFVIYRLKLRPPQ